MAHLVGTVSTNLSQSTINQILKASSVNLQQRCGITSKMHGGKYLKAEIVRKKGKNLVSDPIFNKGLGFPKSERDRLGIRGLVPPTQLNLSEQESVIMEEFKLGWAARAEREPDDEIIKSGVNPDNIRKWKVLQSVQDRNETLFYRLLQDNFLQMAPIIYTPTVGWACSHFSHLYRRPRGMYFCPDDKGEMASMVYNWESDEVDAVVVTDGSRVLGLGDLGIGGLGISIGKLDLYVAAGGFHPRRVLPCVIDTGTANKKLLADPRYLGLKQPRMEGEEYYELIDEFMAAIKLRWPRALIQFEDFQSKHAIKLLMRYKQDYLMFNDDIQGTAATVLAGLYGALRVQGLGPEALKDQKFVICGAGSAGSGVLLTIRNAITKSYGLSKTEAGNRFWIIDDKGLISKSRSNLAEMEDLFYDLSSFAVDDPALEGMGLVDTIKLVKPNILIGLSGCGGLFTDEVLTTMAENCPSPPVIFPLSNPTSRSECTAEQAQRCTGGRAIFASGSPFDDVTIEGSVVASSQCNNRYIFPGLALGAALGQTGVVSNAMINRAAEALVELIEEEDLARRATFPETADIRDISCHLAARVFEQAINDGIKAGNKLMFDAYNEGGLDGLKEYIHSKMWVPDYRPLVYLPPGKGE
ncbi:NAD-dependent malic enzyme 59 kDa isoform, mitochondrial isoform X2 [Eurytemora carolleeae]|uniref:NAD-dependent malic enzyme 59 kDa isoform, mitochondrial isoform X2 n=1 Tax=Eurytemora carolleeae TaxID=1294199 RepID=UPI000C7894A1|nr:NAD-dependent malic enzyme 59 kDa isoform, mitochondrial isoform X2 [Eurytemora carolleeae]|eukprot:XP_023348002.1 NAD-dependent malic enzyme 59 kDa isoform, mitochondrial-like isoform X2 [Eurytemora affinis]